MAPNPLKPLIKGLFVMLIVAGAVLFVQAVRLTVIAEQERVAESQRRSQEMRERAERQMEENRKAAQLRREQEAARAKEAAGRRAQESAAAADDANKPAINLTAAFDRKLRQAADGDPNAQFLTGFVYYVGMDRIVATRDSRLTVLNSQIVTLLIGEPLATKPLVSIPTFKRNNEVAIRWFERAARQGHQCAQAHLSMAHAGRGDYAQAYQWMLVAEGPRLADEIAFGLPPISLRKSMQENFGKRLTPEQVADAEKQAKAFQPKKEKP